MKNPGCCMIIIEIIFVIFLPPVTAFLERGCGAQLAINILLTLLGWFPGMIHAIYLMVATPPESDDKKDVENPPEKKEEKQAEVPAAQ